MAYNRSHAQRMLTASELELFEASLADAINTLDVPALREHIKRARRLRDKHQDLFRRQSLETRERTAAKSGKSGVANQRTEQKAKLFAEVLARFEKRLAQSEAAEARRLKREAVAQAKAEVAARRQAAAEAAAARRELAPGPKGPPRVKGKGRATPESAREAQFGQQSKSPRIKKIQAHVSASGKRAQAKRDKR